MAAALLAVLLLAAGGCARHAYQPAPLDPAALPARLAAARLDAPAHGALFAGLDAAPSGHAAWTPRALALVGASRSPALASARAALATAAADRALAGLPPDPRVDLTLEYNSALDPGEDSRWTVGPSFGFLWSPVDKGRIRAALADADVALAQATVLEAAWAARHRALGAALGLALERHRGAALAARTALLDAAVSRARELAEAGVIAAFEWQMLRLERNGAGLERADRIAGAAAAGADLAGALNLPLAALGGLELALPELPALPAAAAVQRHALTHHPRVLAALATYDHAERALELAIAAQYPDLELNPGYLFDQGDNLWSLVGGIVVPLFARTDAAIARAEAVRDEARARFEQVQSELVAGVQDALATAQAGFAALAAAEDAAAVAAADAESLAARPLIEAAEDLLERRAALQRAQAEARVAEFGIACRVAVADLEYAAALPLADAAFARYLRTLHDARPANPGDDPA